MSNIYLNKHSRTRVTRQFLLAILILMGSQSVFAQFDTEFWFAAPELTNSTNESAPRDRPIQLVISTLEKAAIVKVLQPADLTFAPIILNMPANSTQIVNLTQFIDRIESKPENAILKTGLYIQSTASISAYYEIKSSNNTDIFALKGANALGKLFFTPFQTHWNNSLANGSILYNPTTFASFDVIATDDTTSITITPSKAIIGHPAGIPFTIMLNRGQVYSCRAIDRFGINHPYGSKIESDKDIAVTIKDDMLRFTEDSSPGADIAGDQLIPVEFIGTDYVLIKGGLSGNSDRTYILATEDNTVVRLNGNALPVATLNSGEQYELVMDQPTYFLKASKKVYAWHISGISDQVAGAIIPALSCTGTNQIGFNRTTSAQFVINVITRDVSKNSFTLNGNPNLVPGSAFHPVAGSNGWVYARITFSTSQIASGTTLLLKNSSSELFHVGVTNYAAGVGSNYGYFSNFSRLNLGTSKSLCVGDTAVLDAGPAKTQYTWNTGETTRFIETLIPGKYWVNTLSGTQCPKSDTVRVKFYEPTFNIGPDDTICIGGSTLIQPDGVFTFTWQDGSTNETFLATQPGVYWAQVADFQGCTTRDSLIISEAPRPVTPIASIGDTVCKGGLVTLTMNDLPNANFAWLDPDSNTISGKTIIVNTANQPEGGYKAFFKVDGCESFFDTAFVGIVLPPVVDLGKDTTLCNINGTLLLDPGHHAVGNTYTWSNASGDTVLSVNQSGPYSVSVTSGFGCTASDTINVTFQQLPLSVQFTGGNAFCRGQVAGFGVDEQPGLVYNWTGPNGFTFTGASVSISDVQLNQAGNYSVTPRMNGCDGPSSVLAVTVNFSPEIELGGDTSACAAFTLNLDPTQNGQGYTYLWSDNSTDSTLNVSQAGQYLVAVSNGICVSRDTINVQFGVGPGIVMFTGQNTFCQEGDAVFGVIPVVGETYSWTGPNGFSFNGDTINLSNVQPNQAGQYVVTPSLPGCPGMPATFTISVGSIPAISLGPDTVICPLGTLVLDPSNPNEELFYIWNTSSADSSITILQPGTYSVQVTTDGICFAKDTIDVSIGAVPSAVVFTGTTDYCPGENASFGVIAETGVGYQWTGPNGFTSSSASINLTSIQSAQTGKYYITPGLNSCSGMKDSITISLKSAPVIDFGTNLSICGTSTLVLDPVVFGNGFTYLWNTSSTDSTITVSTAGIYKVTVSNGICSTTDSVNVISGTAPNNVTITGLNTYCEGEDATFAVTPQTDVILNWTGPNGFTSNAAQINLTNIQLNQAGVYTVTSVLNGCTGNSATITINVGVTPAISLGSDQSICDGAPVVLDPIQNGDGFTYLWSTTSTDSSITVSTSGTYSVSVSTPGTSCISHDTIQISIGTTPNPVAFSGSTTYCSGTSATFGAILQANVVYSWTGPNGFTSNSNSINIPNIQPNQGGKYKVSTSNNGCMGLPDSVTITVNPSPQISLGANQSICDGQTSVLDPTPFGNGFTYQWTPASTDSAITVSDSGLYIVTVSSAGGLCSATDSVHVAFTVPPSTVTFSGVTTYCSGTNASFGVVQQLNVTYNWTGPNSFTASGATISVPNIQNLNAGSYTVTPSIGSCVGTASSVAISVTPGPVVNLGPDDTICGNTPVVLDPTNGQPNYNYEWNLVGVTDSTITVNQTGTYWVTVSFAGCTKTDSIDLTFSGLPLPVTIEGNENHCIGDTLLLELQGTQPGVTYNWAGPNGFASQSNSVLIPSTLPSNSGTYTVHGSMEGCVGLETSIIISVNPSPVAQLGLDIVTCSGAAFTLDPTPASAGLTFLWNTSSTDSSIVVTQTGSYVVTITNSFGCKDSDTLIATFNTVPVNLVFEGDTSYCIGESGNFGVQNLAGLVSTWTGPNGFTFSGNSISLSNVTVTQSGYYTVTPMVSGCFGTKDSVFVQVAEIPVVNLGPDSTFCGTTPYQLFAGNGTNLTYAWNTLAVTNSIDVSATGKYYVTVTNAGVCSATDSVNLVFKPAPLPISISNGDKRICEGTTAVFSVEDQSGAVFTWSGPNNFQANGPSISIPGNTANAGAYIITVSIEGCAGQPVQTQLEIKPLPTVSVNIGDLACKGVKINGVANFTSGATILWSDLSSEATGSFGVGTHWATVSLEGCTATDTFIVKNSGPTADFAVTPDSVVIVYEPTYFTDKSVAGLSPLASWEWKLGFAQIQTTQNAQFTYNIDGEVDIQLIVKDQAGCTDTLVRTIMVEQLKTWFIPTMFTPNGDGKNDAFEIIDLSSYPGTAVTIYDRWGKEQFSSGDYKNDWKGNDLDNGVYYFSIKRSDDKEFNGYLFLQRK